MQLTYDFYKEDAVSEAELDAIFEKTINHIEDLEFRNMLSEEGDNLSAVLQITAGAGGYVQFSDGSKQYTANAGSGGGTVDFGFGQIFTSNNSTYANATSANDKVTFSGESGVYVFANSTTKTITVAGTPGAQGLTVDYGFVSEAIFYSIDYGTL